MLILKCYYFFTLYFETYNHLYHNISYLCFQYCQQRIKFIYIFILKSIFDILTIHLPGFLISALPESWSADHLRLQLKCVRLHRHHVTFKIERCSKRVCHVWDSRLLAYLTHVGESYTIFLKA